MTNEIRSSNSEARRKPESRDPTKGLLSASRRYLPLRPQGSDFGFPLAALSRRRTRRASRLSQRGGSEFDLRISAFFRHLAFVIRPSSFVPLTLLLQSSDLELRTSDFLRNSGFGFRISF